MLTSRGWLFILFIVSLLIVAVLTQQTVLFVLTMGLGLWFAWEWLLFAVRAGVIVRQVELQREVGDTDLEYKRVFSPEFRNRLDAKIDFAALPTSVIEQIVEKLVRELEVRLAEKKVKIELTLASRKYLASKGYDPRFGARPLNRLIQTELAERTPLDELHHAVVEDLRGGRVSVRTLWVVRVPVVAGRDERDALVRRRGDVRDGASRPHVRVPRQIARRRDHHDRNAVASHEVDRDLGGPVHRHDRGRLVVPAV